MKTKGGERTISTFKDSVLGYLRFSGKSIDDICQICGIAQSTFYRKLSNPDTMDRKMLRMLHRYTGIPYEELIERR